MTPRKIFMPVYVVVTIVTGYGAISGKCGSFGWVLFGLMLLHCFYVWGVTK